MHKEINDTSVSFAEVTVVIPCYRCKETISRALDSVFFQTLRPMEVILVEDCSSDGSLDYLFQLQNSYPDGWIKVIPLDQNMGPGTARNIGWENATKPFVAFLDSDDTWHPQKTEMQFRWMLEHPEVALTGQGCSNFDNRTAVLFDLGGPHFHPVKIHQLLLSNKFSTPSIMLKKDLPMRFQVGKRFSEDYQLWCEICCSEFECYRISAPLTYCHKPLYGFAGLSANLWQMELGELGAYRSLYKKSLIGVGSLLVFSSWSYIRYMRRVFKVALGLKI